MRQTVYCGNCQWKNVDLWCETITDTKVVILCCQAEEQMISPQTICSTALKTPFPPSPTCGFKIKIATRPTNESESHSTLASPLYAQPNIWDSATFPVGGLGPDCFITQKSCIVMSGDDARLQRFTTVSADVTTGSKLKIGEAFAAS